ncbi:hypothetical protein BVI434_2070005 [Burkholderia vietnamiensis]|nr:hypothetical protein BVI434_2070005 [Burkholderia vietnamiensis]
MEPVFSRRCFSYNTFKPIVHIYP